MLQPEVDWIVDLYIYLCRDTACSVSVRLFLVSCRDLILVSFLISFFYVFFLRDLKDKEIKVRLYTVAFPVWHCRLFSCPISHHAIQNCSLFMLALFTLAAENLWVKCFWLHLSCWISRIECPLFLILVQNGSMHQKDGVNDDDFEPYLSGQTNQVRRHTSTTLMNKLFAHRIFLLVCCHSV